MITPATTTVLSVDGTIGTDVITSGFGKKARDFLSGLTYQDSIFQGHHRLLVEGFKLYKIHHLPHYTGRKLCLPVVSQDVLEFDDIFSGRNQKIHFTFTQDGSHLSSSFPSMPTTSHTEVDEFF
jgi:hypothetical protein